MHYVMYSLLFAFVKCDPPITYSTARARILQAEANMTLGGDATLNGKENAVNKCLMDSKVEEISYGFNNPQYYNFSHHFFLYKDRIKDSKVFKIIQDMPKGALLHIHDMSILGPDYLINVTYMDHLYACFHDDNVVFRFSLSTPNISCNGHWRLVTDLRRESNNAGNFDKELRKHFTMVVDKPDISYPTIKESWSVFMQYFETVCPLLTYRPVWEQYFYDALKRLRKENIMYVEVRTVLPKLYELDGSNYDQLVTAKAYNKVAKRFVKDYPDFVGAKIIFAPQRKVDVKTVEEYLVLARRIKKEVPDIFAGFDLVGAEDLGEPLIKFVPQLEASSDLNFFFHAGETDWYGTTSDENLVDAVLLGAKRIGHGYALPKHPVLMRAVKELDIGVEVNVLSNAILSLVRDIRNHPLSVLLAHGMPVVLSSDDPGAWEADALSDDFYAAFVGVASMHSDLRLLKTLALNSLKYSALNSTKKHSATRDFYSKWDRFINDFNCDSY